LRDRSAPLLSKHCSMAVSPLRAAICTGVRPKSLVESTGTPLLMSAETWLTAPPCTARKSRSFPGLKPAATPGTRGAVHSIPWAVSAVSSNR
jgi:hypothetical protein